MIKRRLSNEVTTAMMTVMRIEKNKMTVRQRQRLRSGYGTAALYLIYPYTATSAATRAAMYIGYRKEDEQV